jgi:ATP-dependent DNA helicase RecQ
MVQRQRRRDGHVFWGCPRYPACKATRDVEDGPGPAAEAPNPQSHASNWPRGVVAEARGGSASHMFFQAAALPASIVRSLAEGDFDIDLVRSFAQWRLDMPSSREPILTADLLSALSAAEAILTRGTTPLCAEEIERLIGSPETDDEGIAQALGETLANPTCRFIPRSAGNSEELAFLRWLMQNRPAIRVVPQIHLSSLTTGLSQEARQRGDFLLAVGSSRHILVEVDGEQHKETRTADGLRDEKLEAAGIPVLRVPVSEVHAGVGPALAKVLEELPEPVPAVVSPLAQAVALSKWVHQCQLAALMGIRTGYLSSDGPWLIDLQLPPRLRELTNVTVATAAGLNNLRELIARLCSLYGVEAPGGSIDCEARGERLSETAHVVVGPADGSSDPAAGDRVPRFLISDVSVPVAIAAPLTPASAIGCDHPPREDALWFLRYLFRKGDFREGQWETVSRTLRGSDSIVLLPTGAGKSIAFQLPALLLPGRCIVVDPIVSLIEDQIDNLRSYGIDRAVGITGQLNPGGREAAQDALGSGHYLFCYVAPERFQMQPFRDALRQLTTNAPISLVAIDEAHCVSEWGHDFRTAYLNIARIARHYCASGDRVPPIVALTGTASRIVLKDVQRELEIRDFDAIITPKSFDRPELRYTILKSPSGEKKHVLLGFLRGLPARVGQHGAEFFQPSGRNSRCGLIFCPHVKGDFGVVQYAESLRQLGAPVDVYSGKQAAGTDRTDWGNRKRQVTQAFKRNRTTILACTKAFGMGIDKPNIRFTAHVGLPQSIEAFYQEAGRAGRDSLGANCAVVLSNDDPRRSARLLSPGAHIDELRKATTGRWEDADDVTRALYFHAKAFSGQDAEVNDLNHLLEVLQPVNRRRKASVPWLLPTAEREQARNRLERALHRLVVLGIVEDYTVNYSASVFDVQLAGSATEEVIAFFERFLAAYNRNLIPAYLEDLREDEDATFAERAKNIGRRLIQFIYDHIEQARRRSLSIMLTALDRARDGEDLRRRILEYLQQTEWDERLEHLRGTPDAGLLAVTEVLDQVASPRDGAELRGAADRVLSSYPDVPGVLLARAAAEALSSRADLESVELNTRGAVQFALGPYRSGMSAVGEAVGRTAALLDSRGRGEEADRMLLAALTAGGEDRELARSALSVMSAGTGLLVAEHITAHLARRCGALIEPEETYV